MKITKKDLRITIKRVVNKKIKMKTKTINHSTHPLYHQGDKFVIIRTNSDINRMPIEARRLSDGCIYGFEEGELK